jgi:hypothetical protein
MDDLPDDIVKLHEEKQKFSEEFSYLSPIGGILLFGGPLGIAIILMLHAADVTHFDVVQYVSFLVGGLIILCGVVILGFVIFHPKARRLRAINKKIREHSDV